MARDWMVSGWLCPSSLPRIGEVKVHCRSPFPRYLAVEHVAHCARWHGCGSLLTLFHLPMLVGFPACRRLICRFALSASGISVLYRSVPSGCSLPEDGANIQPHRPDEHQHHSGQPRSSSAVSAVAPLSAVRAPFSVSPFREQLCSLSSVHSLSVPINNVK